METEFSGKEAALPAWSKNDAKTAKELAKGLYHYLDENCMDEGAKRQKILRIGEQLQSGSRMVYVTALELLDDYHWCIQVQTSLQAPVCCEKEEILTNAKILEGGEKIASKIAAGRIKSEGMTYGLKFSRLEISQVAFEALQRRAHKLIGDGQLETFSERSDSNYSPYRRTSFTHPGLKSSAKGKKQNKSEPTCQLF